MPAKFTDYYGMLSPARQASLDRHYLDIYGPQPSASLHHGPSRH